MEMLPKAKRQELLAVIEPLRAKVVQWRKTRQSHESMPEPLWEEATRLARRYSVASVQGILRIDYRGLQRRALGSVAAPRAAKTPAGFMELPPLLPTPRPPEPPEHIVELEDGTGRRLTVKGSGGNPAEWVALAQALWRA
jgi:hypothetical protein